jgi:hypothetical protein
MMSLAAIALLGTLPTVAQAQFRQPSPQAGNLPAGQTQATIQTMPQVPGQFNYPQPQLSPPASYGGYGGWGGFYPGATGGTLMGTADVVNSQGNFAIQQQQAVLEREQIKSARIDNRRKSMDEYLWERQNLPTREDDRERDAAQELRRMRNNPPVTDIWSGHALNVLLQDIQRVQRDTGARGPMIPIDAHILARINFNTGTTQGTVTMLGDGKLTWPAALKREPFNRMREMIDQLVYDVVRGARAGGIDSGKLDQLTRSVGDLRIALKDSVSSIDPGEYIKGVQYVNNLNQTITTLQQPNAPSYFNGSLDGKGDNVLALVDDMTRKGLQFSPAVSGQESEYNALYQAMVTYDVSLARMAAAH